MVDFTKSWSCSGMGTPERLEVTFGGSHCQNVFVYIVYKNIINFRLAFIVFVASKSSRDLIAQKMQNFIRLNVCHFVYIACIFC